MAKRNTPKYTFPTATEVFMGTRSSTALSAIFRSGGGAHKDKRRAKARKHDWRRDVA